MKIIITGVTGSLGKQLIAYFDNGINEVIGIGRWKSPPEETLKHCHYLCTDINAINQQLEADVLIHAAGKSDDTGKWADFYKSNVEGTYNLAQYSVNCKKFIFISSSSVYLPSPFAIKEEDVAPNQGKDLSNYGRSKWLAEQILIQNTKHESCFILRPRALYGVGDTKILPRMLRLLNANKLTIPGEMNIKVSLTHFDNLINALELSISSNLKGLHIYNVADDKTYILIDVIRKILKAEENNIKEKHVPIIFVKIIGQLRLAGISPLIVRALTQDMFLDLSKIKNELNYQPTQEFDNVLNDLHLWISKKGGPESDYFKNLK